MRTIAIVVVLGCVSSVPPARQERPPPEAPPIAAAAAAAAPPVTLDDSAAEIERALDVELYGASPATEFDGEHWWCLGDQSGWSTCDETRPECEADRVQLQNKMGERLPACLWQRKAACYRRRYVLHGGTGASCASTIKACKDSRAFVMREHGDDVEMLSDCEPTP